MPKRSRFEVVYERDEAGWWVASVPAVLGVHTQARSRAGARRQIREALALAVGDSVAARAVLAEAAPRASAPTAPRPLPK